MSTPPFRPGVGSAAGTFTFFLLRALAMITALGTAEAHAELRLAAIFSNHLVLQAGQSAACWGWGDPGAKISVRFVSDGSTGATADTATVGPDHRWAVRLPAQTPGRTGTLEINSSSGEVRRITDVLIGEVWLGSGQSNMAYLVKASNTPPDIVTAAQREAGAVRPSIRYFMTDRCGSDTPLDDVPGAWMVADADNIGKCSAVAWNFGVALHRELQVPVGLIVSSIGGTPAEAWLPKSALDASRFGSAIWARHQGALAGYTPAIMEKHRTLDAAWLAANPTPAARLANRATRPREPYSPANNHAPTRFYNGMVHGLIPYTIRGIIWFQADGNTQHPEEYADLIRTLIVSWRGQWQAELPFYYVELNNMGAAQKNPVEQNADCVLREAQAEALTLPKTGVAASIDLGVEDPHFPNKKPVGERLAGLALADVYGRPGPVQSPSYESSQFLGDGKVRIKLRNSEGLQTTGGGPVRGFAIHGPDGDWVWAMAKIEGTDVLVWSDAVPRPVAVRYAWARNPVISLMNAARLPLRPFRTDPQSPD